MQKIVSHFLGESIFSNTSEAHNLHKKSLFGEVVKGKLKYSLSEALFLVEKNKMEIIFGKKILPKDELLKKFQRIDKRFYSKYIVFRDLREKGYVLKTALKFGADFRVYDKGIDKKHAKWIVFVEHETKKLSWYEFSAKNRVAHSTKKKLLLAIVDEEEDIIYYEVGWIKP